MNIMYVKNPDLRHLDIVQYSSLANRQGKIISPQNILIPVFAIAGVAEATTIKECTSRHEPQ